MGYFGQHVPPHLQAVVTGPTGAVHLMPLGSNPAGVPVQVHPSPAPPMIGAPVLVPSQPAYVNPQLQLSPNTMAAARLPALPQCAQAVYMSRGPHQIPRYYNPQTVVLLRPAGP